MNEQRTPLYVGNNEELFFRHGYIVYKNGHRTIKTILQKSFFKRCLSHIRLFERLLRLTPRASKRIDEKRFLIAYDGFVYLWDVEDNHLSVEHRFRIEMNNPLGFAKISGVEGFEDCIAYGEYFINPTKKNVAVWIRSREGEWRPVCRFNGNITHIHAIIPAPLDNCVYILTGDFDDEAAIWIAKDNFQKVRPIVKGKQIYRGCVAFATEAGLLYATDTPMEGNGIFLLNREGTVEKLYDMPGPCIYGIEKDNIFFFATSVEPDSNLPTWRYFLSCKPGPGIADDYTHVVAGNLKQGFAKISKFQKDRLPYTLFQFGNVVFPECSVENTICMLPIAVKRNDCQPVYYELSENGVAV